MSVAKHTTYNFVGAIVPALVSIVVLPIYLKAIGIERYGVLVLLWTLTGSFGFLNLGLGPAIAQRLASAKEGDADRASDIVWSGLFAGAGFSLIGTILVVVAGRIYFDHFAEVQSALTAEIRQALVLFALGAPFGFANSVLSGALQGRRQFLTLNGLQVFNSVASSLAPLAVAAWVGPELPFLAAAILAVSVATLVLTALACRPAVPMHRPTPPNAATLRQLLQFGGWVSVTSLIAPLVFQFDRFIIGTLRGATAVSHYVIPLNLVQRLILLPASLQSALFPELAASDATQRAALQGRSLDALSALVTPAAIVGIAILGPFLHIWVGPQIASEATMPGVVLAIGFWVHGVTHVASTSLLGDGRPDIISKLLLAYVVPYLALAYLLIDRFGILGAAFAWLIRAGIEPILFRWTATPRAALVRLAAAFVMVGAMGIACAMLPWRGGSFWVVAAALTLRSAALYARFWFDVLDRFRRRPPAPSGEVPDQR